jgi:hypothetical protein
VVKFQQALAQRYFDAAGFLGRTVGLTPKAANRKRRGNDPAVRISSAED